LLAVFVVAVAFDPRLTRPEKVLLPEIVWTPERVIKAPSPPIEITVLALPLTSVPNP
jgi:hypothetical protein